MPAPEVKFDTAPALVVAYMELRGPYSAVGDAMARLKKWMDHRGIGQAGHPFCLFYDNPGETPAEQLRSEVCIPVANAFEPVGEFRCKDLGEITVAETRHQGAPEDFGKTYGPFLEGLLRSGYRLAGPAREYFMSATDVRGPGSGLLIQQPVAKR